MEHLTLTTRHNMVIKQLKGSGSSQFLGLQAQEGKGNYFIFKSDTQFNICVYFSIPRSTLSVNCLTINGGSAHKEKQPWKENNPPQDVQLVTHLDYAPLFFILST